MIDEFVSQHSKGCESNYFCGKLGMRGASTYAVASAATGRSGSAMPNSPPHKRTKTDAGGDGGGRKKTIDFVLNSK